MTREKLIENNKLMPGAGVYKVPKKGNLREITAQIVRICVESFGVQLAWVGILSRNNFLSVLSRWPVTSNPFDVEIEIPDEYLIRLSTTRNPVVRQVKVENRSYRVGLFPLIIADNVIGVLAMANIQQGFFTRERLQSLQAYSALAAVSLQNAHFYQSEQEKVEQIRVLGAIDQEILASSDLTETANLVLSLAAGQLGADAAGILTVRPGTDNLDFVGGYGFQFDDHQKASLSIKENLVCLSTSSKNILKVDELENKEQCHRTHWFRKEGFKTYIGVPLIARGELRGLLEIYHRSPLAVDQAWFDFLEILANHIAVAIDKSLLLENLHQANAHLSDDYNATIDAFSYTLELRDRETEGHTRRVSEMTLRLAQSMGIPKEQLDSVRKGALLHDIGKLGIPDAILLKPGPLTKQEWEVMRQHPLYAQQILARIDHLQPALDIPLYHHERWDGSGYPYGLKAQAIPLLARIFAVIDVYDALTSNRPYRKAMSRDKAFQYIREQTGQHFDPAVVEAFFRMFP